MQGYETHPEVLEQLCKLLESVAASLEGYGEEESAAYSRAKVTGLRKLKDNLDALQTFLVVQLI